MAIDLKRIQSVKIKTPKTEDSFLKKLEAILSKEIQLGGGELKDRKKEAFYSELSILLSSGIDIRTGLEIITEEQKKQKDKQLFSDIKTDIISGLGLSDAILKSKRFSAYEYFSLKIGEESGRLKDVMVDLTTYFSKRIKQRRQLTSALTYPILVMITAIAAVIFMLTFIVPMFTEVFKRFNGQMPALTKTIISVSDFFRHYTWLMLLAIILVVVLIMLFRKSVFFRANSAAIALRLPLFGELVKKVYVTRYCQSMALLLGARTPMIRSLQLVRQIIGFYPFEKALEVMEQEILHGMLLHQSMAKFNLFDIRIVSLVRVAEEVNQLDVIFTKLNNQYNEELEHQIGMLSSLLEPILIIVVGLLVAVILVSMYLPLFQLGSTVN